MQAEAGPGARGQRPGLTWPLYLGEPLPRSGPAFPNESGGRPVRGPETPVLGGKFLLSSRRSALGTLPPALLVGAAGAWLGPGVWWAGWGDAGPLTVPPSPDSWAVNGVDLGSECSSLWPCGTTGRGLATDLEPQFATEGHDQPPQHLTCTEPLGGPTNPDCWVPGGHTDIRDRCVALDKRQSSLSLVCRNSHSPWPQGTGGISEAMGIPCPAQGWHTVAITPSSRQALQLRPCPLPGGGGPARPAGH